MYTKDPSQEEALLSPPTIPNPPPPRRPAPTPSAPGPTSRCLRCTGVSPIAAPDQTLPVKAFLSKISMGKEFSLGPASHTGLGGFAKFCRERPTRWTSATCGPRVRTAAAADWDIPVMRGCVLGAAVGTGGRGLPLALWISQPGLQWAARAASWCPDLLDNSAKWVVVSLFYREGTEAWRTKGNCYNSCMVSNGSETPSVAPKSPKF